MKTSRFISLLLCVVMIMSLFTGLAGSASADDIIVHEVQSGEIMLKICEKHGLNYYACKNAIMQLNGFTSETQLAKLSVGQKIKLPASDSLAPTVSSTTSVVTSTTIGGTTTTTTTSYVGTTATGGNVAFYLTPYTVQAGDTLAGICSKLNSNYYYYSPVILGVNALANANYIRPGQVLLIPTTTASASGGYAVVAHTVQNGETMTAICNRYGISYQAMRTLVNGVNRRDNMEKIYVGQTVYVPGTTAGVSAAATTVTTSGTATASTATTTSSSAVSTGAGYSISFSDSRAFASSNGQDYVNSAIAGSEVSIWSSTKAGYAVKGIEVIRMDTGAVVPVDYNYFTMPNANVYVEVAYEKGLTIQKEKALYGSFDAVVYGSSASAAFQGDEVSVIAYPYSYYSVASVSYQRSDRSTSAVEVKPDKDGNYKFSMPSYPILLKVTFAPTQYHKLASSTTIGRGTVQFKVGDDVVTRAEQGQVVTMTFVPEKNWEFNTTDFEGNLLTHMPEKNSVASFQKINDTTYTFVMGAKDILISGVQFLNRTEYTISVDYQGGTGTVYPAVIDQVTGNINYNTNKAKFGDTVQVILLPGNNYICDVEYMKANSLGNGNLLPWGMGTTYFTMPDGNVSLKTRFIMDGSTHTYSNLAWNISPKLSGRIDVFAADGSIIDKAEPGDIITVSITPKPNYNLNKVKVLDGKDIWAVTLNGKYLDDVPAASAFTFVNYDPISRVYTYTFVKSSGLDVVNAVFASEYQNVPVKFLQVVDGAETPPDPQNPPVKAIKDLMVNGAYVENGTNVVAGDTVSFTVVLQDGYEVVEVRKFVRDGAALEVDGSTSLLPGGSNNSYTYSYTVTADDIHRDAGTGSIDGELVFEIRTQKKAAYSYAVQYTEPRIEGKPAIELGATGYDISVYQVGTTTAIGSPAGPKAADIVDIPAKLVEEDQAMIEIRIPADKNNATKNDLSAQKTYKYAFDKLLINGYEWDSLEEKLIGTDRYYIAHIIYPKDTANRLVTTEITYKLVSISDFLPAPLTDIKIDNTSLLAEGIFKPDLTSYTWATSNLSGTPNLAEGIHSTDAECRVVINGSVYMDYGTHTPPTDPVKWREGPNTVEIYVRDADKATAPDLQDNKYTVTVNCGLPAATLTKLDITTSAGGSVTGMAAFNPSITDYVAHVDKEYLKVESAAAGSADYIIEINGVSAAKNSSAETGASGILPLNPGPNTVRVKAFTDATPKTMADTDYSVTVYYDASTASELGKVDFVSGGGIIYGNPITVVPGQLEYPLTITGWETSTFTATLPDPASRVADIKIYVNGDLAAETTSAAHVFATPTPVTWKNGINTVLISVKEEDKTETVYTVKVTCNLESSAFQSLTLDGEALPTEVGRTTCNTLAKKNTSEIVWSTASGTGKGTYSIDDGPAISWSEPFSGISVPWSKTTGNSIIIKLKEDNKSEISYTLNVDKKLLPSFPEDYLTIDGDTVTFSGPERDQASYSTFGKTSTVKVRLTGDAADIESTRIEVNGVQLITPTPVYDSGTNISTYTYNDVTWAAGNNMMKVWVKYKDQVESVYFVTVNSTAGNLALDNVSIKNLTGNFKDGASGLNLYGNTNEVTATAADPSAKVTINVYGSAAMTPVTGTSTATVSGITWNTDGHESNRIDITVDNDGYTKTWSITGTYSGPTAP